MMTRGVSLAGLIKAASMLVLVLALSVTGGTVTVLAESYAEAMARVGKDLKSDKPEERAAAVEALSATGDVAAATMALDMMSRESDPWAARDMGRSLRHFMDGKALETVEKRVLRYVSQAEAFQAYWALTGIALAKTEAADAVVGKALKESKEKQFWIKAAALEAIAESERSDLSPLVEWALKEHSESLESDGAIVPITATTTAARIASGKERFGLVSALADMLEKYKSDRIRFFAAQACASITGKKAFYDPYYWRDWVKMEGEISGGEQQPAPSRTAVRKVPKFFDAEAVGTRAIFIIDVSGSMAGPVNVPPKKQEPPKEEKKDGPSVTGKDRKKDGKDGEEKKEVPPPDYSKVKTKLDLAKVELIYTLEQLDDSYDVTVITYHTTHDYLIPSKKGFLKANEANKKLMIEAVKKLAPAGATNIHGAMMRGFRTGTKGQIKGDPATDSGIMLDGVDTIFFLTDGHPNVSDAMVTQDSRRQGVPAPERDFYSKPEGVLADVRRVNTFRKVVIHTVGIGPHAGGLLRALSESSGGTYRDMTGVSHSSE